MELNQKTKFPHMLGSGRIRYSSGMVDGIKLELSVRIEGDVEET